MLYKMLTWLLLNSFVRYRKRKAQEDAEAEENAKVQKEWNKNFEVR